MRVHEENVAPVREIFRHVAAVVAGGKFGGTARELEVLHKIAKGLANKQIASALDTTEYTVKDHLKNILARLRVADRTEAVSVSIQRGIIHL